MRYIKQLYFLVLIVMQCLLTTSCMEEETDSHEREKVFVGDEAYMSMAVNLGESIIGTRSGDVVGSVDELKIHSVRIVLYDGDAGISDDRNREVEYTFEYDITSDSWTPGATPDPANWVNGANTTAGGLSSDGTFISPSGQHLYEQVAGKYQFVTFAQRIKPKDYKMLVILNGAPTSAQTSSPIYEATGIGKYFSQFERSQLLTVNSKTGTLSFTKNGLVMTNHQGLYSVNKNDLGRTSAEANTNPVSVAVDRLVSKVSVLHADEFMNNLPPGLTLGSWSLDMTNKETYLMRQMPAGEVIQTQGQTPSMAGLYAVDPNYSLLTGPSIDAAFNRISDNGHISSSKITSNYGEWEYTLENTMEGAGNKDQMTRLIVGYTYSPPELPQGVSYYVYRNKIIQQADLDKYKIAPDDSQIPSYLIGIRETLAGIDDSKFNLNGTGADYYEIDGLRFCPQGQLFYIIPIRHFDVTLGSFGYYGVVRNNMYQITIKSINPPGVGGPSLSADIHIQPWAGRSQSNSIGIEVDEEGDQRVTVKVYYKSLSHTESNSTEPLNLYKVWWNDNVNTLPVPEYRIMKVNVGESVNTSTANINIDMSAYNHYYYDMLPIGGITAQAEPVENILTLFYNESSGGAAINTYISIYFTDETGNRLYVYDSETGEAVLGRRVRIKSTAEGTVYVDFMKDNYKVYADAAQTIPYKVKSVNYARKINSNVTGDPVIFESGYVNDPIEVRYTENSNIYYYFVAIICEKQ